MTSFLNRSGCDLKTLNIWQNRAPAVEYFERFLQAAPCLQHLGVRLADDESSMSVMNNILERISASPPMHTGHTAGFISGLQSLQLSSRIERLGVYTTHLLVTPQEVPEIGDRHGLCCNR